MYRDAVSTKSSVSKGSVSVLAAPADNSISKLSEYAAKRGIPAPHFEEIDLEFDANGRQVFVMSAKLHSIPGHGDLHAVGRAQVYLVIFGAYF